MLSPTCELVVLCSRPSVNTVLSERANANQNPSVVFALPPPPLELTLSVNYDSFDDFDDVSEKSNSYFSVRLV